MTLTLWIVLAAVLGAMGGIALFLYAACRVGGAADRIVDADFTEIPQQGVDFHV